MVHNIHFIEDVLPKSMEGKEIFKNRASRKAMVTKVKLKNQGERKVYEMTTENISNSGVFVMTDLLFPIGTHLQMDIFLPLFGKIEVLGEVKWQRKTSLLGENKPTGMGIRFIEISTEDADKITNYIQTF